MFKDRKDAGRRLGQVLLPYREKNPLVLAIPRGGVEVGYEAARILNADFSLLICRKLPYPDNPESGFGAIAEDGTLYINETAATSLPERVIEQIIEEQSREIERRIATLRKGQPLPDIRERTVILIDDGIAMGSTMHAAVSLCRKRAVKELVVAVPVAGEHAIREFGQIVDDLIVLESPPYFYAVAQVYENWYDVSDEEVLEIIGAADGRHA